jgi:hypothetical protein
MGHQSVVVTEQHYAHLSPDTMKSAMQVLNDFLPKSLPSSQESGGKALLAGTVSRLLSECRGRESNPYAPCGAQDFKSCASASFATPARLVFSTLPRLSYRSYRSYRPVAPLCDVSILKYSPTARIRASQAQRDCRLSSSFSPWKTYQHHFSGPSRNCRVGPGTAPVVPLPRIVPMCQLNLVREQRTHKGEAPVASSSGMMRALTNEPFPGT